MKKIKITRIADMRRLGEGSAKNLAKAGIETPEQLHDITPKRKAELKKQIGHKGK